MITAIFTIVVGVVTLAISFPLIWRLYRAAVARGEGLGPSDWFGWLRILMAIAGFAVAATAGVSVGEPLLAFPAVVIAAALFALAANHYFWTRRHSAGS